MVPVTSLDYADQRCVLVHLKTREVVGMNEQVQSFRGEAARVVGGRAPHKSNSTGKVHVIFNGSNETHEYYASVFGLAWVEEGKLIRLRTCMGGRRKVEMKKISTPFGEYTTRLS